MISRRQLIAAAGTGAFILPVTMHAQGSSSTKRHIAQAAHLTIEVPEHWSHTPPLPGGPQSIGADDGFFVALPITSPLNATAFAAAFDLAVEKVTETQISWHEMDAVRLEYADNNDEVTIGAIVVQNPRPILTMQGQADYLLLAGDTDHFDRILDTIEFGLENVAPSDIAKSIVEVVHTHSYFRDEVDWENIYQQAEEIESAAEIDSFLKFRVLRELRPTGDNHSFVTNLDGVVNVATPTIDGQEPNYPSGEIIDGYGYISFPSTNLTTSDYPAEYARLAAEFRNQFLEDGVCGWIIDLRNMRGGSVSPPLTALYPFLPDGKVAGFVDAYSNERWIEKSGESISPLAYVQEIDDVPWPHELENPDLPVAVLTGGSTASAGEFVQLALMSRPNLQTFGLQSAGYTTGNIGITLFHDAHFALASTAELDVYGNVYTGKIEPDVEDLDIGRGQSVLPRNLTTALDWLDAQCVSSLA